jgi:tetratricopeptide (TPR) repeat protein
LNNDGSLYLVAAMSTSPSPRVFVSATSADLGDCRRAVADVLLKLDVYPVVQEHFPPDYRTVREMLHEKIAACDAMICLLGRRYGCEPVTRPDGEPRRSYTQIEQEIAAELGKPTFVFVATEDCPFPGQPEEPPELQASQAEHVRRMTSGDRIWQTFRSLDDLAKKVGTMRFDPRSLEGVASRLVVVLLAELIDTTAQRTRLGAETWIRDLVRPYHDLLENTLVRWQGTLIAEAPTDCLVNFGTADKAVLAALTLHHEISRHTWKTETPQVRVGIHLGQVLYFGGVDDAHVLQAGQTVDTCRQLAALALPGHTLLTSAAFDAARQSVRGMALEEGAPDAELSWLSHGRYVLSANHEPLDVREVGVVGGAPLVAPPNSAVAQRADSLEEKQMEGWRPSLDQPVPRAADWIIEAKLGEGGFGEVWLAQHRRLKERHVFKFCFDAERLRSFKRELAFFKLIQKHLGERDDIAKLYDVSVDEPPFYLESDYVESGDLARWAERQGGLAKVPLERRLELLARVARAVAAAHSLGIIHKDLKPSNIFIVEREGEPRPRLADFGIGVLSDRSLLARHGMTETDMFKSLLGNDSRRAGTRLYSPSEAQTGAPATTSGDIYALGVMLYQLVVGDLKRPLGVGFEEQIADDLLREDVAACTHQDPARRLAGAMVLAERLETLDERRRAAAARRRAERVAARLKRLKAALAIAAAATLLFASLGAFAALQWRRAEDLKDQAETNATLAHNNEVAAKAAAQLAKEKEQLALENEARAKTAADAARQHAQLALDTLRTVIFDVQRGLRNLSGSAPLRRDLLRSVMRHLEKLSGEFADRSTVDRDTMVALSEMGDVILRLGTEASGGAEVQGAPTDDNASLSDEARGAAAAARSLYRRAFAIGQRLAESNPGDVEAQRSLSVCYDRLGDVTVQLGQTADALKYYQDGLEISRKLTESNPGDAQAQRGLAVSHNKLGNVTLQLGRTADALKYYQDGLEIRTKLAESNPGDAQAQRDLSTSYSRLGNVTLQLGQTAAALKYYQNDLEISRKLAESNPGDAQAQRDLSISYSKLGNVTLRLGQTAEALKYYQKDLEISRKLAESNPADAQAQRDLSMSYGNLGDVTLQLGQTAEALKYYQKDLEIDRKLAESNPADAQAQRDLSVSYDKLGDVTLQLGQTVDALKYYQDGFEIRRKLAESNPGDAQPQRDLMVSQYKLAKAAKQDFEYEAALEHYQEASRILEQMLEQGLLKEQTERDIRTIKQESVRCAAAALAFAGLEQIDEFEAEARPMLLYLRCAELSRHGDVTVAAEAADKLRQIAGAIPDQLYLAASGYSVCVRALDTPPRGGVFLPPDKPRELSPDEQAARQKYLQLALKTLEQAVAAGYNNADQMRQDDDLIPLRELPEFQRLLAEVATKQQKP